MTIKDYLNSKAFRKEYKCWYYAKKLFDENGNDLGKVFDFGDDGVWEDFIATHLVVNTETGWELGDDHELYAYCRITTRV